MLQFLVVHQNVLDGSITMGSLDNLIGRVIASRRTPAMSGSSALVLVMSTCTHAVVLRPLHVRRLPAKMVLDLSGTALQKGQHDVLPVDGECVGDRSAAGISYAEQFEDLFTRPLQTSKPVPKPSNEAQAREKRAVRVPFSGVYGTLMRGARNRSWSTTDIGRATWFILMHGIGLLALCPRFFSWPMLGVQFLLYCASGMGITYSYHRQLAHKSFKASAEHRTGARGRASPNAWPDYRAETVAACSPPSGSSTLRRAVA